MKLPIVDISRSLSIQEVLNGLPRIVPYVLVQTAGDNQVNHHTMHWLEYCETQPTAELIANQPVVPDLQTPMHFDKLPQMLVELNRSGTMVAPHVAFKAVCRRDQGKQVGVIRLGKGVLWTVIP